MMNPLNSINEYCELAQIADSMGLYKLADEITKQLAIKTASTDVMKRLAQVIENPFYVLGISPNATPEEAEEAYFKMIDEMGKRKREKTKVEDFLIQKANWAINQINNATMIENERQIFHPKFPDPIQNTKPKIDDPQPWWKKIFKRNK
jgi:DnaJ-domain-containing protein 1